MSAVHSSDTYYFQKPINSMLSVRVLFIFIAGYVASKICLCKVPVNAGGAFATEMCFNLT